MNDELEEPEVGFKFTFRDSDDGNYTLRQVALGFTSMILIEPEADEEGNIVFNVDVTNLDREELGEVFQLLTDVVTGEIGVTTEDNT